MFVTLYKSLVRPIIEYGNTIWGPHFTVEQQNIEKVQHRATRILTNLHGNSYSDRLQILGLPTLKYRRLRRDMILLYRLVNNDIGIDFADFFIISSVISTRGKNLARPTEQDVTLFPQEQLTAGTDCQRMLSQLGLSMNLREN